MMRINLALVFLIVCSAVSIVTSQHKARKLFQALEKEQGGARQLEVEFGQLQLELSTWATSPRIEKIAREKLRMHAPDPAKVLTSVPKRGAP